MCYDSNAHRTKDIIGGALKIKTTFLPPLKPLFDFSKRIGLTKPGYISLLRSIKARKGQKSSNSVFNL